MLSGVGTRHHGLLAVEERQVPFAGSGSQGEAGQGGQGVKRSTGVRPRASPAVTIALTRERFRASLVHGVASYAVPKTEHIFPDQQVAEMHKWNADTLDIKRKIDTNIPDESNYHCDLKVSENALYSR